MKRKLLFIINPYAGKQEIRSRMLDITDIFIKAGFDVTVYITQKAGEIQAVLSQYKTEFDMVVSSGGDGTLNEVVNGLMSMPYVPVLCHIPAGTINDFASSLGIPRNIIKAAELAVKGAPLACDIGMFNQKYFTYVAAFGIFTDVPYVTAQQSKNIMGRAAYLMEGIRRLSSIKSYRLTIEHDGQLLFGDFIFGMIFNSRSVAGIKLGSKFDISLCDGQFEVLLVKKPENLQERQQIMTSLLRQDFDMRTVYVFKCSQMKIISDSNVPWTLDGEFGGIEKTMEISICPKAIRYMVPKKYLKNI